jgi:hypothetical protein
LKEPAVVGEVNLSSSSAAVPAGSLGLEALAFKADPYGPSPLVTDLSIRNRALFELASERSPAPTLFASGGDLPPFTASGVEPELLNRLPYAMRHAAASEASAGWVLNLIEQVASDPVRMGRGEITHPGLDEYRMRMDTWVRGLKTPEVPFAEADYPDQWKTPRMRAATS